MGELDETTTARIDQGATTDDDRPSIHLADEIPRGTAVGRYVVIKRLGIGGMGVVYLAFDGHLDRRVALKVLRTDAGVSPEATARLHREAQVMARLAHPNVVAVFDVGALDAGIFIAMEYVKGENLRQWRASSSRSPVEIVSMFAAVGRGLAAAHAQTILHRDFKPENVIVDEQDRPRVLDFGLARAGESADANQPVDLLDTQVRSRPIPDAPLTEHGVIVGTPAYMAPEQLRGEAIDARADQFAFCIALYESLYGTRPFAGATLLELRLAMEKDKIRPPPRSNHTPGPVFDVLARGLRARGDERWPDMTALIAALEHARGSTGRRTRMLAVAAGIVAALGIVGGVASRAARPSPCVGADVALGGVWDPSVRSAVAGAFRASGNANAEASLDRVTRALDEYAGAWVSTSTEACVATRVRGAQSDEALDLRTACLHQRLENARAVTHLLASADSTLVDNALGLVRKLPAIAECDDLKALRATYVAVPPESAAAVEAIRHDLADVASRNNAGMCEGALTLANAAAERATSAAYVPVQAEALYWKSKVERHCTGLNAGFGTMIQASALALQSHQDELMGRCFVALAGTLPLAGRFPEAESYGTLAEAAIRRLGEPAKLVSDLASARATLAYTHGDLLLARRFAREALAAHTHTGTGSDPEGIDLEARLTDLSYEAGALQETLEAQLDLVQRATETLGAANFRTGRFTLDVVETLNAQGKYAEARRWLDRALPVLDATQSADQGPFDDALIDLGGGDPERGFARISALWQDEARRHGANDVWPLSTRGDLAKWLVVHRRTLASLAMTDALLPQIEALGERDTTWYSNGYAARALALARTRGGEEALAQAQHAASVAERGAAQLPFALLAVGEAMLALKRPLEALAPLERALRLVTDRGGIDAIILGDIDRALARAVDTTDPSRARQLRQNASVAYLSSREPSFASSPDPADRSTR